MLCFTGHRAHLIVLPQLLFRSQAGVWLSFEASLTRVSEFLFALNIFVKKLYPFTLRRVQSEPYLRACQWAGLLLFLFCQYFLNGVSSNAKPLLQNSVIQGMISPLDQNFFYSKTPSDRGKFLVNVIFIVLMGSNQWVILISLSSNDPCPWICHKRFSTIGHVSLPYAYSISKSDLFWIFHGIVELYFLKCGEQLWLNCLYLCSWHRVRPPAGKIKWIILVSLHWSLCKVSIEGTSRQQFIGNSTRITKFACRKVYSGAIIAVILMKSLRDHVILIWNNKNTLNN